MAMRDPKEWAEAIMEDGDVDPRDTTHEEGDYQNRIARIIREAQEDGARAEREKAEHEVDSWRQGAEVFGLEVHALRAQVAALTERAERAEENLRKLDEVFKGRIDDIGRHRAVDEHYYIEMAEDILRRVKP